MLKINSEKLNSIISDVNSFYEKREDISDLAQKEFESIKRKTLTIIEDSKSMTLPSGISTKLNTLSLIVNGRTKTLNDLSLQESGLIKAFEYTPVIKNNQYFTKDNGTIAKFSNIIFSKVLGVEKRTQGIIDDLTKYDGISTLSLSKNINDTTRKYTQVEYLHDINIKDKYSTLFDFRLNRFPVKTHNKKGITKQYTSRRSDIISFNYESTKKDTENSISFGAMAPYGVDFSKKIHIIKPNQHGQEYFLKAIYKRNYSPFSIAASITYEKNKKLSVYTDYKFELAKFYNVRLDVEFVDGSKEYILGLKNAIDTALISAESFSYDGMSFSSFEDANSKIKIKLEKLREPLDAFNYAFRTYREHFVYADKNYNTIKEAYLALDNFENSSREYSNNFEYEINTSKETFSINDVTYNTIQDAQDYLDDYSSRFSYAITAANERFTYEGYTYNTIEEASDVNKIKSNQLTQLMVDWNEYQQNNNIEGLKVNELFVNVDLPLFTSTFVSGTTSNTLTYNSISAVSTAISSRSFANKKFEEAIENQINLVDEGNFVNNPITFDGVIYTQILDVNNDLVETAQSAARSELNRLYNIYQTSIDNRKSDIDNNTNYFSDAVTYDGTTYDSIEDAQSALYAYNRFSDTYLKDFNTTIKSKEENLKNEIYSFTYDGFIYDNEEDIKAKQTELNLIPVNYEKTLKQLIESKQKELSKKILNNQILVLYSGENYGNIDALDAYNNLIVLLSGYGKFGKTNLYKFTLYVNGKQEKISSTLNKVWGVNAKYLKKHGAIATRPGFNPIGSKEVLYHLIEERDEKYKKIESKNVNARGSVKVPSQIKLSAYKYKTKAIERGIIFDKSYSYIIKKLEFGKLLSIDTVPYKVKFKPNYIDTNSLIFNVDKKVQSPKAVEPKAVDKNKMPTITLEQLQKNIQKFREDIKKYNKLLKTSEKITYTKLYNNYLYKTNNGVDFGEINIYYTKQKPKLAIIALDQEKSEGDEFKFEGTEFRVKGLMDGDSVDSVTLSSIGTDKDADYTFIKRAPFPTPNGINKNGYLIRPSNAQGTGLDKYDIHYNIGILRVYQADSKDGGAPPDADEAGQPAE